MNKSKIKKEVERIVSEASFSLRTDVSKLLKKAKRLEEKYADTPEVHAQRR